MIHASAVGPNVQKMIGSRRGIDMNSTADQLITGLPSRYIIRRIVKLWTSGSVFSLASGGIYTAAGKTGTVLVAASQAYNVISGPTKYLDLNLAAIVGTDIRTEPILYFSLSVAQGSASSGELFIFGDILN